MYLATTFIVPGLFALASTVAWTYVVSRMTNIKINWIYRWSVVLWMGLQLLVPVIDLNRNHDFASGLEVWLTVAVLTGVKIGNLCLGIWVYRLLGMAYPVRIALSPKEPASALASTEAFMADSKAHPCLLENCTAFEREALDSKVKSREMAIVVKQTVAAAEAAQSAESAAHEAVAAVDEVQSAVGNLTSGLAKST